MTKESFGSASFWAMLSGVTIAGLLVVLSIMMEHNVGGFAYLWYAVLSIESGALMLGICGWRSAFGKMGATASSLAVIAMMVL